MRSKATYKVRRLQVDGQPGWIIAWWHWCHRYRSNVGRCSRYASTVITDWNMQWIDERVLPMRCDRCGAWGQLPHAVYIDVKAVSDATRLMIEAGGGSCE